MEATKTVLIIVLLLAISGCSRSPGWTKPGMISAWERQLDKSDSALQSGSKLGEPTRTLADTGRPSCLKDRMNATDIAADIARLERKRGGIPMKGVWHGIDLSKLPRTQADFLLFDSGKWLQTSGNDFPNCDSSPCVINTLYGTAPDALPGLKLYWWYLRMGYVLSLTDDIPRLAKNLPQPLRQYYFSDQELSAFWKLTWALPENYRSIAALQTIHRIPSNIFPASWGDTTCGDAWGTNDMGNIRLGDGCLTLPSSGEGLQGFFFIGVTHEISHRLDALMGDGWESYSNKDEWRALSAWTCETLVDTELGRLHHACKAWKKDSTPDSKPDGFVRAYAGTTPGEDFADTAAYFRFSPEETRKASPKKFELLARKIFGGRSYDAEGLANYYADTSLAYAKSALVDVVGKCADEPTSFGAPFPPKRFKMDPSIPQPLVSCTELGLNDRITQAFDQLRGSEYEACDVLDQREADLRNRILDSLQTQAQELLARQPSLQSLAAASRKLRATLAREVEPRQIYLHCFRLEAPESCYTSALAQAFETNAQNYSAALGETLPAERAFFLDLNSYARTRARVLEFFTSMFAGADPLVQDRAEILWSDCGKPAQVPDAAPGGQSAPPTSPFTGGQRYVNAAILQCVNGKVDPEVARIRDSFAARIGLSVSDPDAAELVKGLLLPRLLATLSAALERDAAQEDVDREALRVKAIENIVAALGSDLSWMPDLTNPNGSPTAAMSDHCVPSAISAFQRFVSQQTSFPTRFAALEDVGLSWGRAACRQVISSPAAKKAIDDAQAVIQKRDAAAWTAALSVLEQKVSLSASARSLSCRAQFPAKSIGRLGRSQCLKLAWPSIETEALASWSADEASGKKFQSRRQEANNYLVSRRKALQTAAIAAMEK